MLQRVQRRLVQANFYIAMHQMAHAVVALHGALEDHFIMAVGARPETEVFQSGAMLQQPVQV